MDKHDLKILAIDDTPDNLTALQAVVADAFPGVKMSTALNGENGIELALAKDPDVILLDIVMPGMDGFEVCRRVKKDERLRHVPVIFLTALKADRENRVRALEAGADAFLSKPIDELELTVQIRAMAKIKAANQLIRMEKEQLAELVAERTKELEQQLTKRKQTEMALRASEERYKMLANNIPDIIYSLDDEGNIVTVNQSAYEQYGYYEKDFKGKSFLDFIHPEDRDILINSFLKAIEEKRTITNGLQFRIIAKDGSHRWFELNARARFDSRGSYLGEEGMLRDITERKQAEEALKESEAAVRKKLDALIEPEGDIGTLELSDIIDTKVLQSLMEDFYRLTGMLGALIDLSGKILVAVGWQDICTKFHRCHPETDKHCIESDTILTHGVPPGTFKAYRCKNHMWDTVTPLMVGGRHVGNIFIGQFLYEGETPDVELFREQARKYGFDETEYLAALDRVPRFSREAVDAGMQFYAKLAGIVSTLSFSAIQQSRLLTERKRSGEALRESAQRFRDVAHSMADWIWEVDNNGKYIYASGTVKKVLGYSPEELMGKTPFELMPEEERAKNREIFLQIVSKTEPIVDLENWNITKDGTKVCLLTNGVPIIGPDGELSGYRGVDKNITSQKKFQEEKTVMEAQLQQAQKMESIGNLAGGIAHDFNNILSSIIGFTELSLDDVDKDSLIEDNLQEVYTAGKRAKDLVRQILAFARQSEEKVKPIQVNDIIEEVLQFIRSSIPATIEIRKNIDSDSIVMGNQTQVHQIMMNLCTNAAYAMEDEGGILNVDLKDTVVDRNHANKLDLAYGNYIEISVSDTGTGIPPDILGSIFEPYFTTKEPGEGTGMGLAMVHGIVESYGGKITLDSTLGKGATFTIYLPVTRKRKTQRQYEPEQLPSGTERILFVDDEAPIAKMGSQGLERLGYTITTRTSSIEALALFRSKPNGFDLVITDMTMPNMTGDKLAIELMKIRSDIPIILCTGYSKKFSEETASEIGIKAFAYKPIVKAALAETVRKVLDEAKDSVQQ